MTDKETFIFDESGFLSGMCVEKAQIVHTDFEREKINEKLSEDDKSCDQK